MAKKNLSNVTALFNNLGDKLDIYLNKYQQLQNENKVYDESAKTLDLTKIIPAEELSKILTAKTGTWNDSQTLFEKFFDLSLGREDRYSEYEQIIYRIPEASQALQVYVDSVLAPDAGDTDKKILIDTVMDDSLSSQARLILEVIFDRSRFYNMLPQIVYTALLYGDAFVEIEPTSNGVRYILHPAKNCSLVYDKKTDIEMGLLIRVPEEQSNLKDILTTAYPEISIDVPQQIVAIVSDKSYLTNTKNKYKVASMEQQMTELLKDIYKDENAKFRYLAPHRYVRFPIYYNNNYYPYGTSILDPVRSIAKQLLLIEAALAIYRATRTPLRSMWTLDVTGIPGDQIPGLMRGVMEKVRRQKILDNEKDGTLSIDSIPEIMGEIDDIWNTKSNGTSLLEFQNLPVPDLTPYTNDADYFRNKLLSSLGIPPSYLGEEGGSTRALLTLEDVKFSRTIKRLQSDINNSLNELADLCFALIGKTEYMNKLIVTLPQMNSIEANMKAENLAKRLDVASNFSGFYPNVPKLWIMKNIIGFTDREIQEMEDTVEDQKGFIVFQDQKFSKDNEAESGNGGGFGGFDFGGNDMDFDNGPEEEGPDMDFEMPSNDNMNINMTNETETNAATDALSTETAEIGNL